MLPSAGTYLLMLPARMNRIAYPSLFFAASILGCFTLRIRRASSASPSHTRTNLIGDQSLRDQWGEKDGEHKHHEEVLGDRALGWVREQNAGVVNTLGDPEKSPLYSRVLDILDSTDKIPYASKHGDLYYNFWKDATNPRGVLRRTSLQSYKSNSPTWETVLDIDKLGKDENESWVYQGSDVYHPIDEKSMPRKTLLSLSPGGSDASTVREFDLISKKFVSQEENGFIVPSAKSRVNWITDDICLIGTDFNEDGQSLTDSGYPLDIRLWVRGESYKNAKKQFEGEKTDVAVTGYVSKHQNTILEWRIRAISFYTSQKLVRKIDPSTWTVHNVHQKYHETAWHVLDIPDDASASQFGSQILIKLKTNWSIGGIEYTSGSLLAVDLEEFITSGKDRAKITVLFSPSDRVSLDGYSKTLNHLVIEMLDNVKSRVQVWKFSSTEGWIVIANEEEASVRGISLSAVDSLTMDDCWVTKSSFTTPSTLSLLDLNECSRGINTKIDLSKMCTLLKSLPAKYDARDVIEFQEEATSADGTKVPYFVVMKKSLKKDGSNPTLLYGYGGFLVSILPSYPATIGCTWIEQGNIYVSANIRGGGEFGPRWHQEALKENRIKAYEDFIAVAEDLIAKGYTSPRKLGIRGGSNGGLLMGNMLTLRPDLFGAIVNAVPLLDMKRYSHLLAGASWMAEYGNPDTSDWEYLQQYSPYHNVKREFKYPPLLVTTSTKDDRVHPYHARAFVNRLIDVAGSTGNHIYYYENIEGGHGGAADSKQTAFMTVLYISFLNKFIGR